MGYQYHRSLLRFVTTFAIMTCPRAFTIIHRTVEKHRIVQRTAAPQFSRLFLSSLSSATKSTSSDPLPRRPAQRANNTGGLRRLPVVKAPNELMSRAAKVARSVKADRYCIKTLYTHLHKVVVSLTSQHPIPIAFDAILLVLSTTQETGLESMVPRHLPPWHKHCAFLCGI